MTYPWFLLICKFLRLVNNQNLLCFLTWFCKHDLVIEGLRMFIDFWYGLRMIRNFRFSRSLRWSEGEWQETLVYINPYFIVILQPFMLSLWELNYPYFFPKWQHIISIVFPLLQLFSLYPFYWRWTSVFEIWSVN